LVAFAGIALVFLVDRAMARGRWPSWLVTGMAFGLAVLLKTTFVLFLVSVLGWMAWRSRGDGRAAIGAFARNAASLGCGVALLLAPAVARNVVVGAPPACLSSVAPITFLLANAEDYPPDEGFFLSRHASEILAKTDGQALPMVIETLRTHPGVSSYVRQLWGKFGSLWHWYEKPNNENFYYYRLHAPVLRVLPVTFLIVAPLSIVGLLLAAPRFREHASLYLLLMTSVAPLLAFYVLSRLRIPLVPALIPFAALTVVWIAERLRPRRWAPAAAGTVAILLVWLWTGRPLPPSWSLIRPRDYRVPYGTYWGPVEAAARDKGNWREAADVVGDSLRYEPAALRSVGPSHPPGSTDLVELSPFFAIIHERRAEDLTRAGDPSAAAVEERRAGALRAAVGGP